MHERDFSCIPEAGTNGENECSGSLSPIKQKNG